MYKCSIIADPEGNAWQFAQEVYNQLRGRDEKYELNEVRIIREFPDSERLPKIMCNVRRKNCFFIHDGSKNADRWLNELAFVNQTMRNSSAQEITDVLPYLRYARQDRKDESRVPISAKVVADIISLYADRVLTIDVHSPQNQGFYNIPFDNLYSFPVAVKYFKENHPEFLERIVAADSGAGKRVEAFVNRVGSGEPVYCSKKKEKRDVDEITVTGDVEGRNCLIVEDIITSGGTAKKCSKKLKDNGARKVGIYAAHGLFTKGVGVLDSLDLIVVGDSFPNPSLKETRAEVVSFVDLFSEAIYRINEGESLSALFD